VVDDESRIIKEKNPEITPKSADLNNSSK